MGVSAGVARGLVLATGSPTRHFVGPSLLTQDQHHVAERVAGQDEG